jgi:hypothetical protein
MAEEKTTSRDVGLRHYLPWLPLFRAFSIALDPKKLMLAALGLLITACGWWGLALLFRPAMTRDPLVKAEATDIAQWPWQSDDWRPVEMSPDPAAQRILDLAPNLSPAEIAELQRNVAVSRGAGVLRHLATAPVETIWGILTNWRFVLRPLVALVRPFQSIFASDFGLLPILFAFLCALWAAIVWAFFGGAITRIAAVQVAREEKIGLVESLRFAVSKFLSFLGAPIIPLVFIAFFTILCLLGGLISRIPGFGPVFAGALWFLPLTAGLIMAIILVGWAIGWPLMYATISVEGSDSFDALSRSYAYAFTRPWHYLFYAVIAFAFGSLCAFVVILFADLTVYLARWAVEWGGADMTIRQLMYYAPLGMDWQVRHVIDSDGVPRLVEAPTGAVAVGAWLAAFWLRLLFCLVVGFAYSYFWSASTIIYYLLRRDVDNTEIQEVFLEDEGEEFDLREGETSASEPAAAPAVVGSGSEPPPHEPPAGPPAE